MSVLLEQINSAGQAYVEFAIPMLIQSSLLILILLFVDLLLRKKIRAGFRYWIWTLVLVKLALPTSLSTPVSLGHWFGEELATMDVGQIISSPRAAEINTDRHVPLTPGAELPLPVSGPVISPGVSEVQMTWQGIVFVSWLVIVMVMTLMLLHRTLFVRRLVAQAQKTNGSLNDMLAQCCHSMGIRRNVGLRISTNMTSPAVCRLFRPVILLPQSLMPSLDVSQLRAILMHELAHLKRFDLWVNCVQTFLQIIYFYNPLLWFANAIIRRTREQAVDEAVLVAMGEKAQEYLETLVNVAKLAFRRPTLSLRLIGVMESKNLFDWRIRTMLSKPIPQSAKLGVFGTIMILVSAVVLLPMAKAEKSDEQSGPSAGEDPARSVESLHDAAIDDNVEQIKLLISKGADVNTKQLNGWTPLHCALYYEQKEVAKVLIAKGADVNATNTSGVTPLHLSVGFGGTYISELLISAEANVNAMDNRGNTPLHYAARQWHIGSELLELLLTKGADVNVRNNKGQTPLHFASLSKRDKSYKGGANVLLAKGAKINAKDNRGCTPLHVAAESGHIQMVELLLAQGAVIEERNDDGEIALHQAARSGYQDVVELLLNEGANVNCKQSKGRTALHYSAEAGHLGTADLLIRGGANINAKSEDGETPLDAAALASEIELCTMLIEKGAKVESLYSATITGDLAKVESFIKEDNTTSEKAAALCAAAACGQDNVVDLLISKGVPANARNKRNETALHLAARGGFMDVAKRLLSKGADVNATGRNKETPLHYALDGGSKEVIELLVSKGAVVNAKNRYGETALHLAAQMGQKDVVVLLVNNGAAVQIEANRISRRRRTPFDYAAIRGHKEVAEFLIKKGAIIKPLPRYLLHHLCWAGYTDMVELLIQKGANVNPEKDPAVAYDEAPSHYAVWNDKPEALELLLSHGANPDAEDRWGWSLLHYTAGKDGPNSTVMTKMLLEKGANPNLATRGSGLTPLQLAAARVGGKTAVEILVNHGADVNLKDWNGKTALVWAQDKGHIEIVELLKKHGAKE